MSPGFSLHPAKTLKFQQKLLKWYRRHRRELPWRQTQDPYKIWVSEIMLQQTQVATVIPYYERFIQQFPSLQSLASAPEEAILAAWSGLGYYRRAKLLHRGVKYVITELGGTIPQTAEELKALPSIGEYTAGAIASIAFGQASPLVDGNVIRVYARLFAIRGHRKDAQLKRKIWELATTMMSPVRPGDFNQALMELGATRCRSSLPTCETCPVKDQCQGYQSGQPEQYPETPPKGKTLQLHRIVAVAERGEKILLVKRKNQRWFQGLWELPHDYVENNSTTSKALEDFLRDNFGVQFTATSSIKTTRHSITHHRITTQAWQGKISGTIRPKQHFEKIQFFAKKDLPGTALPNFDRKVLQAAKLLV